MQLQIETTNVCNAACVFCPYPTMERPKGLMTMELFRKIIDEAATIPQIELVTLTGLGETLLDRHLLERIRYIKAAMPAMKVDLYTNGSLLSAKMAEGLADAGLSVLYVSLNGIDQRKRFQLMKLDDYDKVVEQIRYAMSLGKYRVMVKAILGTDLMEHGDQEIFYQQWGGKYDNGGSGFIHLEGNWSGLMWTMRGVKPQNACQRALGQIMVLRDGRVSLCCFDGEGKEILGDLNTQGLREVFNGEKATAMRQAHWEGRRQEIPICANCTGI